jgi:DNA-binding NarL/FixJ family response regulator
VTFRVLLVDDQALVRSGFRMLIDAQPDMSVIGEASDGEEAVRETIRTRPDVVVMDVRMPRLDGIDATRRITDPGKGVATRVLILTTYDLDEYVFRGLRAGASGFLLKDAGPEELLRGIRVVAEGASLLAPSVTRRLIEEFVRAPELAGSAVDLSTLTEREREVFELIGHGMSNGDIAARLFLSTATVKTHVNRIFMKLGVRDRVQAVVVAYQTGVVRAGASKPLQ